MVWARVKTEDSALNPKRQSQYSALFQGDFTASCCSIPGSNVARDDNNKPYCGQIVNNSIRQQNIQRLEWTANLPDLIPIEHTWNGIRMQCKSC